MAAVANAATSVPAFSNTKLWPMASFGSVPWFVSFTVNSSPAFASIAVTLNFIWSLAVISMVRPPDFLSAFARGIGAAAVISAGAAAGAAGVAVTAGAGAVEISADD